jgi:type VI secretion system secreted protein VgrG
VAVLELSFESKEDSLSVRHFTVRQALSSPFDVAVVARSKLAGIDLESIVGRPASLLMMGGALAAPRVFSGVCSHMDQLQAETAGLSTYFIRIVPSLWLTTQRRNHRIFEHMTIPAIAGKVLDEYSITPRVVLGDPHGEHEYRVQYGESDFAFLSRLLEEEGISYLFEQVEEGAGVTTRLVLTDRPEAAPERSPAIPFAGSPNEAARKEYVTRVRIGHRMRPGHAVLRDFDFMRPDFELKGESVRSKAPEDFFEQYRYAPAALIKDRQGVPRAPTELEGKLAADITLQAERRGKREVAFEGNAFDLAPGVVFSMDGHPRRDLAPGKSLLVTECSIEGNHDSEWTLSAVAEFTDVRFRPLQRTPKPVMKGVESAIVVGRKGEEIHTDAFGRVRVQFHWDRDGEYNEQASCWVRVSQGWAGAAWGSILLPRVGQEVIVDFIEGDPDQPVVVGRAFNKISPVPFKLPARQATSDWKSHSSPDSEGFNEILFDDEAGKELLYIQAQRNLSKLVKANETERTGANRTQIVGGSRSAFIGAVDSTVIGARYALATMAPQDLAIGALGEPALTPQATMLQMADKNISFTTGKVTASLDDAHLSLLAEGSVIFQSGGEISIEGKHVHINGKPVTGSAPPAGVSAEGGAKRPQGRTLGAVKAVFGAVKTEAERLAMTPLVAGYRPPTPRERILAGSEGTTAPQRIARRKVALEFYKQNGMKHDEQIGAMRPYRLPDEVPEIWSHLTGIDFTKPVSTGPPPPAPDTPAHGHLPPDAPYLQSTASDGGGTQISIGHPDP